jgi:hypothetical protein
MFQKSCLLNVSKWLMATTIFLSGSLFALCKDCSGGRCHSTDNGYSRCVDQGCRMDGPTEVCTCLLSGNSCQTAAPGPGWGWPGIIVLPPYIPPPENGLRDGLPQIKKSLSDRTEPRFLTDKKFQRKDVYLESLRASLSASHSAVVVEALSGVLNEYADSGELPEIVEVSARIPASGNHDEGIATSHRFSIIAQDRQLVQSSIFELRITGETGKRMLEGNEKRTYRFSLQNDRLQALPSKDNEK